MPKPEVTDQTTLKELERLLQEYGLLLRIGVTFDGRTVSLTRISTDPPQLCYAVVSPISRPLSAQISEALQALFPA